MAEREVVAVTGASGGVGRAIAREFARHGGAIGRWHAAIWGRESRSTTSSKSPASP